MIVMITGSLKIFLEPLVESAKSDWLFGKKRKGDSRES